MNSSCKLPGVFYGWWIVGACFFISLLVSGFVVFGFTAFFEPIADELGWSHAQISLGASIRGAEAGLLAPLVGLIIDRWGPRRMAFLGAIITGLGLVLISFTTSLSMFYGTFILIAIGFSGCSPTVVMTAVANWFRKKVGIATGIMICGYAFGGLILPPIVRLIDIFDWRTAIFILGLCIWATCLPLSLLLKHKPERYGYLPDGEQANTIVAEKVLKPVQVSEADVGARQALGSRSFWHLAISATCLYIAISAVIVHVMPSLSSTGITRSTASLIAMAMPLLSIIGRIGAGWLGDMLGNRQVATDCYIIMGLGLLAFSYVSDTLVWLLVPFIILFGIGWGANATIRASLLREYFGRSKFGTIYGLTSGMVALGSILGPFFTGWVFDNYNSYHSAWVILSCLIFLGVFIIATTPATATRLKGASAGAQ